MACYVLTMNKGGKLQEVSNEGIDWMFPQFQAITYTSVVFTINKMIQGCVGKADIIKRSDEVGTSIFCGSTDDMVMNPTLDVLSTTTSGGYNLQGDNQILIYLNLSKILCMQEWN